jgi:hypothetical protein
MGRRGMLGALLLALSLYGSDANAASASGGYFVLTTYVCVEFVNAYSAEKAVRSVQGASDQNIYTVHYNAMFHYVSGWLSSYNATAQDTYNIVPGGISGAMLWLDNYCTKNPLKNLDDGLRELVTEAYPSRQQKAP